MKKKSVSKTSVKKTIVKNAITKKSVGKKIDVKKSAIALPTSPIEDIESQLEAILKDEPNLTMEDLKVVLASLTGSSTDLSLQDELIGGEADTRMEAQLLAIDAMEAESAAQARKLVKRALQLDPDCVDALLMLGDLESRTPGELTAALRKAVSAGERSLGEELIRKNKGHFWMILETRPYMRALQQLAEMLRLEASTQKEAIQIYERMLELNPNDNQGVRDPLLALYLELGDLKTATRLLKKYKNDHSANMAWARSLYLFLSGDVAAAGKALQEARKANRFVELYFTGQRVLPNEMPEMYEWGSDEEAVLCLNYLSRAWSKQAEAGRWLMSQLATEPTTAASKPAVKKSAAKGRKA